MPALTDQAIVLRTWDFSETSQTLALLTREHGIVRALAKGSRRPRSAFDGGLEMLTRGHIAFILKPTSELATLTEWGLAEVFPALRSSLESHRAGLYLADLTHHLFHPNDPHPRLFDAMLDALRAFDAGPRTVGSVLGFLWSALSEAGYTPIADRDARTDDPLREGDEAFGFSAAAGGLVPDPGPNSRIEGVWRMRGDTRSVLMELGAGRMPSSDEAGLRAARLLGVYAAWLIGRTLPSAGSWEQIVAGGNDPVDPK